MEIKHQITENLTAKISINFVEEDYQQEVTKALKEQSRKASIHGFRPGKVPFGMIKKMYGEAVMADTISNKLGTALDEYLKSKDFKTLGQLLIDDEEMKAVNFNTDKEFTFNYVVGLKPEFDIEIDDKLKLDFYNITVAKDAVDKYLMDVRKRFGTQSDTEFAAEDDIVMGNFAEVNSDGNEVENGVKKDSSIHLDYIKNKEIKADFLKLKKNESLIFNPQKAFKNEIELASILGIALSEVKNFKSDVKFTLSGISHFEPADINEDLFSKVYENDHITNEDELRERILRDIEGTYKSESKNQFMNELVDTLLELTNLNLPDEFMKKWILENNAREENDKKISRDELDLQYVNYRDTLRWQIIEEHISDKYGLKISNDEIKVRVGELLGMQAFGGDDESSQKIIDQVTESVMQNKEEVNKIASQIMEQKLTALFKEKAKVNEQNISYEDFITMVSKKVIAKSEKK